MHSHNNCLPTLQNMHHTLLGVTFLRVLCIQQNLQGALHSLLVLAPTPLAPIASFPLTCKLPIHNQGTLYLQYTSFLTSNWMEPRQHKVQHYQSTAKLQLTDSWQLPTQCIGCCLHVEINSINRLLSCRPKQLQPTSCASLDASLSLCACLLSHCMARSKAFSTVYTTSCLSTMYCWGTTSKLLPTFPSLTQTCSIHSKSNKL